MSAVSGTNSKVEIQQDATLRKSIDKLFQQWDKLDSPGASVCAAKDGNIIYSRGFGSANLEYDVPITPSTVFHVASVSKQFTAMAIALLAREGKLSFDDDIRKYLPEIHDFGKVITIRHLLTHTSGLRDQWELLEIGGYRLDDVITQEHILNLLANQRELNFAPGEEFMYCNSGYTLLTEIVGRVSGKTFTQFTEERIFKPLEIQKESHLAGKEIVEKVRCLIIGSGPAGYTAAIYAARANLKPVLYTGLQMGGQLTTTTDVENFPGYPDGVKGPDMMEDLKKQAERFGTDVRFGIATSADFSGDNRLITFDDYKVIDADVIIISTGATAKYLGLPAETKYAGMGV
jgi:hypothetical protein